jgi:hypothetical protein
MADRVYHWKHGWIPLDATAMAEKKKSPVHKVIEGEHAPGVMGPVWRGADWPPTVDTEAVDGAPNVLIRSYKKSKSSGELPLIQGDRASKPARLSEAQKVEIAHDVQKILDDFPGIKAHGRKQLITGTHPGDEYDGQTDPQETMVALNQDMWHADHIARVLKMGREGHFGIPMEASDGASYRQRVVGHEMAHVMHIISENRSGVGMGEASDPYDDTTAVDRNPLNAIADEMVTPRELGFTKVPPGQSERTLDYGHPRWMADSLGGNSVYAYGQNRYEWIAEAFADGYFNGDKATPQSKRILAVMHSLYGGSGAYK